MDRISEGETNPTFAHHSKKDMLNIHSLFGFMSTIHFELKA